MRCTVRPWHDTPSEVPSEFIPERTKAAREKFAGMLEFLEAETV